jgi:hypothetical protein
MPEFCRSDVFIGTVILPAIFSKIKGISKNFLFDRLKSNKIE